MKRIAFILFLSLFISCKENNQSVNSSQKTLLPDFFDVQVSKELGPDSLQYYLNELIKVPKKHVSDSLKADFAYVSGRFKNRLGRYDEALEDFNYATSFSKEKIHSDREVLYFKALMDSYFVNKNDLLNAEGVNEKLLYLLDNNDYVNKAYVYDFKRRVKASLSLYEEALRANDSAIKLYLKSRDTVSYFILTMGRWELLRSLSLPSELTADLVKVTIDPNALSAEHMYRLHTTLGENMGDNFLSKIATYKNANFYAKQMVGIDGRSKVLNNYLNISKAYMGLGDLNKSENYIDSVFDLGFTNIEYFNQKEALKTKLSLKYKQGADIQSVISQLDTLFAYQDRNYGKRINSELGILKESLENEKALEVAKKQEEVQRLKVERNQFVLGVLLLLMLLVTTFIVYFYKQRKLKSEHQYLLMQQRLLRSQMNPHFTFNSLNFLGENIKNNQKESSEYVYKFSSLLRSTFKNSTKDYVPIEDELKSLEDYIKLQQYRFPNRFTYTIKNNIDPEDYVSIPPMLLQPFVENSILHGFKEQKNLGELLISISAREKYIHCVIDDNGNGMDLENMKERSSIKLIDEFLKRITGKGVVIINKSTTNSEEKGTKVELGIPCIIF